MTLVNEAKAARMSGLLHLQFASFEALFRF